MVNCGGPSFFGGEEWVKKRRQPLSFSVVLQVIASPCEVSEAACMNHCFFSKDGSNKDGFK